MFTRKLNIVLALAVCAILLPMTVGAGEQQERPMYLSGSGFLVVTSFDPVTYTGTWEATETGEATHLGRYSLVESGTFSGIVWPSEGTFTAADDDTLGFEREFICQGWDDGKGGWVQIASMDFTGGTGRFVGASGHVDLESVTYADGSYTISGRGTITY